MTDVGRLIPALPADADNAKIMLLKQLASGELGVGWPHKPGEKALCKKLVAEGKLIKRGRAYEITPRGRAFVGAVA